MALAFGALKLDDDDDAPRAASTTPKAPHLYAEVACPDCGAPTRARRDGSVQCLSCLRLARDDWRAALSSHIARYPKALAFGRCPGCMRVAVSESAEKTRRWDATLDRESPAFLAFLLRKLKATLLGKRAVASIEGLSRSLEGGQLEVRDARFVWTEPHSRRVKVEVEVRHAFASGVGAALHKVIVEFVEEKRRCEACLGESSSAASRGRKMGGSGAADFAAKVQVRVARRDGAPDAGARTLRSLEDGLRATSAATTARSARKIARNHRGFDVEFDSRQAAAKFVTDLKRLGRAPLRVGDSTKKLATHDPKANTAEWQRTLLLTVPPVDKHDLVVDAASGTKFALVLSVRHVLRLVDVSSHTSSVSHDTPNRGGVRDVSAEHYFRHPLDSVLSAGALVEFDVIDADAAVRRGTTSETPSRFFAPFAVEVGRVYKGYDLAGIKHRVHVPASVPNVVLVAPVAGHRHAHKTDDDDEDVDDAGTPPPPDAHDDGDDPSSPPALHGGDQPRDDDDDVGAPADGAAAAPSVVASRKERRRRRKRDLLEGKRLAAMASSSAADPPAAGGSDDDEYASQKEPRTFDALQEDDEDDEASWAVVDDTASQED